MLETANGTVGNDIVQNDTEIHRRERLSNLTNGSEKQEPNISDLVRIDKCYQSSTIYKLISLNTSFLQVTYLLPNFRRQVIRRRLKTTKIESHPVLIRRRSPVKIVYMS